MYVATADVRRITERCCDSQTCQTHVAFTRTQRGGCPVQLAAASSENSAKDPDLLAYDCGTSALTVLIFYVLFM